MTAVSSRAKNFDIDNFDVSVFYGYDVTTNYSPSSSIRKKKLNSRIDID